MYSCKEGMYVTSRPTNRDQGAIPDEIGMASPLTDAADRPVDSQLRMLEIASLLLGHRRLLIGGILAAMLLAGIMSIMIPNCYWSRASLLPTGKIDKMGELTSLAGFSSTDMTDENSSKFFPVILRSELVKNAVLETTYSFVHDGKSIELTLPEYFETQNRDQLYQELDQIISVSMDKKTGVIELGAETRYPRLSQMILTEYIRNLESYNLHKRSSQARSNANYLSRQVELTRIELAVAEDSLCAFQEVNRNWAATSVPQIIRELGRLQREVEIKSGTLRYLVQQLESARLEAQKDVPIVCVLDKPSLPTRKSAPSRARIVALGGITAFFCLTAYLVAMEVARRRTRSADREAYLAFRNELGRTFSKPSRILNLVKSGKVLRNLKLSK